MLKVGLNNFYLFWKMFLVLSWSELWNLFTQKLRKQKYSRIFLLNDLNFRFDAFSTSFQIIYTTGWTESLYFFSLFALKIPLSFFLHFYLDFLVFLVFFDLKFFKNFLMRIFARQKLLTTLVWSQFSTLSRCSLSLVCLKERKSVLCILEIISTE